VIDTSEAIVSGVRPESGEWDALVDALDERIDACVSLPLQVPTANEVLVDPLTGRRVLLSAGRVARPETAGGGENKRSSGPYREGRTPPTLFYVPAGRDGESPPLVVETETGSLVIIRGHADRGMTAWEAVDVLGAERVAGQSGELVPAVFPRTRWWARTFLNVAPIVREPGSGANGFVIAVHPDYEDDDLAALDGGRGGELPTGVVEAVVLSWTMLQSWADRKGLLSVPFVNGGKDPRSGQSLAAFHAQFYAVEPASVPIMPGGAPTSVDAEETVDSRGSALDCPLCGVAHAGDHLVTRVGSVGIFVHPAPASEYTLLIAPFEHVGGMEGLPDPGDFAEALREAVRALRLLVGRVPAYNVAVRAGRFVGHLHAEVIPREGVPVAGGFERVTGFSVATHVPKEVAAALRGRLEDERSREDTGDLR